MMTEKITSEPMTSGQRKQFMRVLEDAVNKRNPNKNEMIEILKSGNLVQLDLIASLNKYAIEDKRFGPAISEFEITVPSDYVHDTQIDSFGKKTKKLKTTYYFNEELTSANFAKATNKLVPGKSYDVKIFPILKNGVPSQDCMNFLKKQNAILVGGQGITLLQSLKPELFPVGKYTLSFDEKDALWKGADGYHWVPYVVRHSGGGWRFRLGFFEGAWGSGPCLLCFCDKKS